MRMKLFMAIIKIIF
uniref:Orf n=1 Tax=Escherichia coli O157:H7 TaxID=83334 RepID=Q93UU0_ECO57|nr:orf [Escherichia coli O157:H7]